MNNAYVYNTTVCEVDLTLNGVAAGTIEPTSPINGDGVIPVAYPYNPGGPPQGAGFGQMTEVIVQSFPARQVYQVDASLAGNMPLQFFIFQMHAVLSWDGMAIFLVPNGGTVS